MKDEPDDNAAPPLLNYGVSTRNPRPGGLSRWIWWALAGVGLMVLFGGMFATNGRLGGPGDIAFIVGLFALIVVAIVQAVVR